MSNSNRSRTDIRKEWADATNQASAHDPTDYQLGCDKERIASFQEVWQSPDTVVLYPPDEDPTDSDVWLEGDLVSAEPEGVAERTDIPNPPGGGDGVTRVPIDDDDD